MRRTTFVVRLIFVLRRNSPIESRFSFCRIISFQRIPALSLSYAVTPICGCPHTVFFELFRLS